MPKNPYSFVFGKEPLQNISRIAQESEVLESFCEDIPSQQVYMITGIRGSGKTVFMTEISKKLKEKDDWIVAELNPERDMLESLGAKLCSEDYLAQIFKKAKLNLSFFGFGLSVEGVAPVTDIETAISKMLGSLKKHKKRLLIAIDEVTNTKEMRIFASAFQIFVRQEQPIFLLMTGLYDNINALQNEKNLTFLYRAPRIELKALNIGAMADNYEKVLKIKEEQALQMARLTKGYSFAFQVLGYLSWENDGNSEEILGEYKQYLEEYVYEKLWSELSRGDKRILYGMANCKSGKIIEIRNFLGIETNEFNPYRKRLIRKGLITGDDRSYVRFALPLFDEYVIENYDE